MADANSFGSDEGDSAKTIRLPDPEPGDGTEPQYLAADLLCLARVDHFETGGVRDTIAQVVARWREVFRRIPIEAPRPRKGLYQLPFVCPLCGKPVELQAKSWLRTNLLPLCGSVMLGPVVAVVGWFNIEAHGWVGIGIAVAGLAVAVVTPLITLMAPSLLDTLPSALRIVKDEPRDPSTFPIPGGEYFYCIAQVR